MMMARLKGADPATLARRGVTATGSAQAGYTLTCDVCGATWPAPMLASGRLAAGYWRCPSGCNAQPAPSSPAAVARVLDLAELPAILTPAEAARLLRVSELTVKAWARAGELPGAFKLGKEWRVDRDALLEHIRGGQS